MFGQAVPVRAANVVSTGAVSVNSDMVDLLTINTISPSVIFNAPDGSPIDGQSLSFIVKGQGNPVAFAFNAKFVGKVVALPIIATIGINTRLNFVYDASLSVWNLVSVVPLVVSSYSAYYTSNKRAIFGYGYSVAAASLTNLVSNTGVVATDTTGVGTARYSLAASGYGTDKAIFGYGYATAVVAMTNLVSNTGVVATDTTGVGTTRAYIAAASFGIDKAIFGYGYSNAAVSMTNLVSNIGVVATDTAGVGTARYAPAAASFGIDKAIFGYGYTTAASTNVSMTNLVSNTGVVATDTTGVGTARFSPSAASYGTDKAIFGYGCNGNNSTIQYSVTNLVSNTGVVATDTAGVGTARYYLAAAGYGVDKAIFGYGFTTAVVSMTNLVSNTGVVATDTTGVGTARYNFSASGYGA